MSSIPVIIRGIGNILQFQKNKNAIPGIDFWNSHKNSSYQHKSKNKILATMPRLRKDDNDGKKKAPPPLASANVGADGVETPMTLSEKQLSSKQSTLKKRASKSTVAVVITKRKKKGKYSDPLYVDPPDEIFAPYFEKFQSKPAPTFTAVEDLILCKAYATVSDYPTIGMDQTVETFWGKIFTYFIYLSATETDNGTF